MYLRDIITQLRKELPKYTNTFCTSVNIKTASYSAGYVTIETLAAHNLTTNDIVTIVDCQEKIPISSLTRAGAVVTAVTSLAHDLTLDYIDSSKQPPIVINGCTITAYNGSQTLTEVTNRTTFKFNITGTPSNASDGYLIQKSVDRYSGLKTVTVIDGTHFRFPSAIALAPTGFGGSVKSVIRAAGAVNIDRAIDTYTKQIAGAGWIFVTPSPHSVSKDRNSLTDASSENHKGIDYRQNVIAQFEVFVLMPCSNELAARAAYDSALTEVAAIFRALLGYSVPSPYKQNAFCKVILESHGPFAYSGPFYIHQIIFSTLYQLYSNDTIVLESDRAFRDIDFTVFNGSMTGDINSKPKLDG